MLIRTQRMFLLLAAVALLYAQPLHAATVAVGTCLPAYPHFNTIQAAINASPLGGTVLVCPGTYVENISIFHPLTLKGVNSGGSNMALISMPPGSTGAQIYVQATGVNISDLTIDGSNNGANFCGVGPYGIYYYDASGGGEPCGDQKSIPYRCGISLLRSQRGYRGDQQCNLVRGDRSEQHDSRFSG